MAASSMASISSEGSMENSSVEQEEIAALTHDVRNFKDALGKLRKVFHSETDASENLRVAMHERLGDVLRILRSVLDKYPTLQSTELLLSAGCLIQQVKGYSYGSGQAESKEFLDSIDQLALAFSSRVSEYLMGDLDNTTPLSSSISSKARSCDNLATNEKLSMTQIDTALLQTEQGVELALQHAKLWAKYAKDILMYVEKKIQMQMDYSQNLQKLALTMRPLIKEQINLPFQSIYGTAIDNDMDNSNSNQLTCSLLLGKKFHEPLSTRRMEHEKIRKQMKLKWQREVSHMHEVVARMHSAHRTYIQSQQECEECVELNKKKVVDDEEMLQKALEAESTYKAHIAEANECHAKLQTVKSDIIQRIRELIVKSDNVMKTVTVAYFQLQHTLHAAVPTQFQTLWESSQSYEPGSQYLEFVKSLPRPQRESVEVQFNFEPYSRGTSLRELQEERKSVDSFENESLSQGKRKLSGKGSDTESNASHETTSTSSRKLMTMSSCDEMSISENDSSYLTYGTTQKHCISKAAETHTFRKLKTPSRCRECDSYVYFQGSECAECGLACHKKCLEQLAIQCGHKRLPRKMTTFGVDLGQHLAETRTSIPHIISKCINEIDNRGLLIKGIYRVSGVKSKVEKLCQAFENGAELVDLTDVHPNVIANVLKLYLRQLPEPLLTFQLYGEFVRIAKECSSNAVEEVDSAIRNIKELVHKLPVHHYRTLATLMHHLERVANGAHANNMPPSNLGIVFGPTLLRTAEGSASLNSLVDTIHQTRAIELMIANAHLIFEQKDTREASRNFAGEGATAALPLDDELCFLLGDEGALSTETAITKVFKGSLKDYQGLEGLNLGASYSKQDNATRKNKQEVEVDEMSKTVKQDPTVGRTESSADSDYSFESHASSSVESRSPRELEESCDVFLEMPLPWQNKGDIEDYIPRAIQEMENEPAAMHAADHLSRLHKQNQNQRSEYAESDDELSNF